MKKAIKVRSHKRRLKTGKVVSVCAHTRNIEGSEEIPYRGRGRPRTKPFRWEQKKSKEEKQQSRKRGWTKRRKDMADHQAYLRKEYTSDIRMGAKMGLSPSDISSCLGGRITDRDIKKIAKEENIKFRTNPATGKPYQSYKSGNSFDEYDNQMAWFQHRTGRKRPYGFARTARRKDYTKLPESAFT